MADNFSLADHEVVDLLRRVRMVVALHVRQAPVLDVDAEQTEQRRNRRAQHGDQCD
jgi:hypothetical protein